MAELLGAHADVVCVRGEKAALIPQEITVIGSSRKVTSNESQWSDGAAESLSQTPPGLFTGQKKTKIKRFCSFFYLFTLGKFRRPFTYLKKNLVDKYQRLDANQDRTRVGESTIHSECEDENGKANYTTQHRATPAPKKEKTTSFCQKTHK